MTNAEFATTLEKLAEKYRENDALPQVYLSKHVFTKEGLRDAIKGFGGKWIKKPSDDESEHAWMSFESTGLEPLSLTISRNSVCRRTVTYDCDPIMSPEEEAEVLA